MTKDFILAARTFIHLRTLAHAASNLYFVKVYIMVRDSMEEKQPKVYEHFARIEASRIPKPVDGKADFYWRHQSYLQSKKLKP